MSESKKVKNLLSLTIFLVSLAFFSSCDNSGDTIDIPLQTGILVVNEGNFGSGNGTISFYDEEEMTMTNNVVKNANGGSEIASTIQSLAIHDGVGYVLCNGPDKIEIINAENYTYLDNPISNVSQPRYMAAVGGNGYVSCWGPWDNWTLPASYIAVVDLATRKVTDSLECGSGPESILAVHGKLFVANSFETSLSVIDLNDNSSIKIDLNSTPQHIKYSSVSGNIWLTVSTGIIEIDPSTLEIINDVEVTNISGKFAADANGENLYLITMEPWSPDKTDQASEIRTYNTLTNVLSATALITGDNFYGIGYNVTTDRIYVSDSKAFTGPGQIYLYDPDGNYIDDKTTGIGPNGFGFK